LTISLGDQRGLKESQTEDAGAEARSAQSRALPAGPQRKGSGLVG